MHLSVPRISCGSLHLVQSPQVTHLVLLVLALDDLHLALHRPLVEHWAYQV